MDYNRMFFFQMVQVDITSNCVCPIIQVAEKRFGYIPGVSIIVAEICLYV
jgi:hypothetical protein